MASNKPTKTRIRNANRKNPFDNQISLTDFDLLEIKVIGAKTVRPKNSKIPTVDSRD